MVPKRRTTLIAARFSLALATLWMAGGRLAPDQSGALSLPATEGATSASAIERVDAALTSGNVSAAEWAWHEAYTAALSNRRWEELIEVGDANLRIGVAGNFRKAAVDRAHFTYLAALFRARRRGSVDGVLRAGEAFEKLGDRRMAEQAARIAEHLVGPGGGVAARAHVGAFAARFDPRVVEVANLPLF